MWLRSGCDIVMVMVGITNYIPTHEYNHKLIQAIVLLVYNNNSNSSNVQYVNKEMVCKSYLRTFRARSVFLSNQQQCLEEEEEE